MNDCTSVARSSHGESCSDKEAVTAKYGSSMRSWCVSSVTDMSYLFASMTNFNEDISVWNVSSVTKMDGMFENAASFNQDLSLWNVSSVTSMNGMFKGAKSFNLYSLCSLGQPKWAELLAELECSPEKSGGSVIEESSSSLLVAASMFWYLLKCFRL